MEATLIQWMGPRSMGIGGAAHGGELLRMADETATLAAMRHSGKPMVTVGVEGARFVAPVSLGNVVTALARVNAVWRTSAEVGVKLLAEGPTGVGSHHVFSAYFMVVIDPAFLHQGPLPALPRLDGPLARRRRDAAQQRRDARLHASRSDSS